MLLAIPMFIALALATTSAQQLPDIPGADQIGIGIDAITGDFKVQSLFKLSYRGDKTWTNPFHADLTYRVPDQVEVVSRTSSGSTANLYATSSDYANKLSHGAGLDAGFGAAFSGSAEVNRAKTFLSQGDASLSVTEETVKLNSLSLLPPQLLQLSDSLADAISSHLPATYDESAYATFVSYFGSHYVTGAEYGGKATMMSSVKRDYIGSNSALVANANARVKFQQLKGADIGASFSHSSTSDDYQQACSNSWSVEMVGGNAHLNMSAWADWTDSVKLAPAQISFRVVSMDRIMPDEARATNFRTYLARYYAQHNHTDKPVPAPPLRLGRCQCTSFPYNGAPANPDSLLTGLESTTGGHIGGTRETCVPCYTLANKFGGGYAAAPSRVTRMSPLRAHQRTDALLATSRARLAAAASRRRDAGAPTRNSTCGILPCLPGVDAVGVGFDALLGESRDLSAIKLSYVAANAWTNPFYTNLQYNYADQLNVVTTTANNKYSTTYNDTTQYAADLAQKAGLSASAGAYGGSLDVSRSRSTLSGSQSVLNVLEQDLTLYEVSIAAYSEPSSALAAMEAWLPAAYEPQAYAAFVAHFGTHFVAQASFGGTARQRTTIDQHFFTSNAGNAVAAGVNGAYANFQAGVRVNRTSSDDMKSFANNSISEIQLLGGNYERLEVHDWSKWQVSTRLAPSQVSVKLHPLHELFKDAGKARNLKSHVQNYIARGAAALEHVAVSRQHPLTKNEQKLANGKGCDSVRGAAFLADYGMNVPIVHSALSPAVCRNVAWSPAPRGSVAHNKPLTTCGEYRTMSTTCDQGGFMVSATYDVSVSGSWKPPILCRHICYKQ